MPILINFDKFVHYLAKVKAIIDDFDSPFVCVLGDFNADIVKATEFGKELESFCRDSQLSIVDVMHLPRDSTTHMNDSHSTESWLDHIVCTKGFMDFIGGVGINRSVLCSDHFPMFIKIDIQNGGISSEVSGAGLDERWVVDWASLGPDDLRAYASAAENNLKQLGVPFELLQCGICSSIDHVRAIDVYYDKIIASLRAASESTISKKLGGKARRNIPGWNDFVKDNHVMLCDVYALWALVGKPRDGYIYRQLCLARSRFKYALRHCLRHEKELRAKSLADKFVNNPYCMATFWKEVRRLNSSSPLAPSVDGISGEAKIADMWKDHFSYILNSVNNTEKKYFVLQQFSTVSHEFSGFSVPEVTKAIDELASGRSCGNDRLCFEHFKFAGSACATHLSLCFNMIAKHRYLPYSLTEVVLSPIVKGTNPALKKSSNIPEIYAKMFGRFH